MSTVTRATYGLGATYFAGLNARVLARVEQMAQALNIPWLATLLQNPAPVEHVDLDALGDASAGSTSVSAIWSPPYPVDIITAEFACAAAGGATGTGDLHIKPSGGSFASGLSAAVDVKTGAGTYQSGTVVSTSDANKIATTTALKAVFASGSGGSLTVGKCRVWYRRTAPQD